jgi:site-specific recombinase XerD
VTIQDWVAPSVGGLDLLRSPSRSTWHTYLLVDRDLPPSSVSDYRIVLWDWVRFCEQQGHTWEHAPPALLDRYLSHPQHPLGGSRRGDPLVPILEFYADGKRLGLIRHNPLEDVKLERSTSATERGLDPSQVAGSPTVRESDSPTAVQRQR